jgi:hypothetical protein
MSCLPPHGKCAWVGLRHSVATTLGSGGRNSNVLTAHPHVAPERRAMPARSIS